MYYCGIDIAKHKHAVALLDEHGHAHKAVFMTENTQRGMDILLAELKPLEDVRIGLEATGHYWLNLYDVLTRNGYPVSVINPMQISAYRKSGLRKVKNDRTDAVWIADFLRITNLPVSNRDLPVLMQLRELTRFRFWLSEQIGDCKRKLLTILDRVFPEYETLFSNVFLTSSRALLQEVVSAQEFADFDLDELAELLATSSRRRFGLEKAKQIRQQAQHSIGVNFLTDAAHVEMRCLLAQVDLLEEQQLEVEKAVEGLMQQIPQHITSIPGVGAITGAAILAEIGDIHRFESPEKLVAYAGIDATVHQSGQFEAKQMHMSKRGSPYLRLGLWQAASMSIIHNEELKLYYQKKRSEGKPHRVAIGALCRKLLIRIYVILKENRPYQTTKLVPQHP
ncbi:MAG: IS110 family transposase [Chloroflexi bacterium]|nr:IS110 family transposase [Chloroflexota bacterium]